MKTVNSVKGGKGMKDGIGDRFQQETKYRPNDMGGHFLDWSNQPKPYKNYETCLATLSLPEPDTGVQADLWHLLSGRRSRREYSTEGSLTGETLSTLLWATQGITERYEGFLLRTAPSAGGLYPVETYLFLRAVDGFEPGIYHFRAHVFDLEFLKRGDCSRGLAEAALGQMIVVGAQVTFIWSAVVERSKWF